MSKTVSNIIMDIKFEIQNIRNEARDDRVSFEARSAERQKRIDTLEKLQWDMEKIGEPVEV